ncbi:MAG: hypothetical protein AAGJ35_02465, partial [Myxococcota bacterium]
MSAPKKLILLLSLFSLTCVPYLLRRPIQHWLHPDIALESQGDLALRNGYLDVALQAYQKAKQTRKSIGQDTLPHK